MRFVFLISVLFNSIEFGRNLATSCGIKRGRFAFLCSVHVRPYGPLRIPTNSYANKWLRFAFRGSFHFNPCEFQRKQAIAFRVSVFSSFQPVRTRATPCELIRNQTRAVRVSMFLSCRALLVPANSDEFRRTQTVAFHVLVSFRCNSDEFRRTQTIAVRVSGFLSFQPLRLRPKPREPVRNQTRTVHVSMFLSCKARRIPAKSDESRRTQTVAFRVSGFLPFQPRRIPTKTNNCVSRFWFPFFSTLAHSCDTLRTRSESNASGSRFDVPFM